MHSGFRHSFRTDRVLLRRSPIQHHQGAKCQVDGVDNKPSLADNKSITSVGHSGSAHSDAVPNLTTASCANPAKLPRTLLWCLTTGINSELEQCDHRLHSCRGTW